MSVLAQLLTWLGRFVMNNLGGILTMLAGVLILDSEWVMGLATEAIGWLRPILPSLIGNIENLQNQVSTQWSAASPYLAMANSIVPIDYAVTLAGILFALYLAVLGIRVAFSIRNLVRK